MIYLFLTLLCFLIHGFFSMSEMAYVSFNRVRLQYYVNKQKKRAIWLSKLLKSPTFLFGTTLIGVNTAMQFGSECARRFYFYLGLSPDYAPITQIFLVLILAELAPMFAARRYPENVSMLGIPVIYSTSIVLRPIIYFLDFLCRIVGKLFKASPSVGSYLSRDELQRAIESREDKTIGKQDDFDQILSSIFSLKKKIAKDLLIPLKKVKTLSSDAKILEVKKATRLKRGAFYPIFHGAKSNIIAVAYPRDLIRHKDETNIRAFSRAPWFITEKSSILQILKQFRRNNQSVAIVLNELGVAIGVLTLDLIIEEVFGGRDAFAFGRKQVLIDRTFSGDTEIIKINKKYKTDIEAVGTLEEVMEDKLGHFPEKLESVQIGSYELTVEDSVGLKKRLISVKSK